MIQPRSWPTAEKLLVTCLCIKPPPCATNITNLLHCLIHLQVDLSVFDPATLMANSTAADQVTVADVLVGSKADAAAAGAAEALQQWAADELFPLKQEVGVC